jgi:hypothetical protein
MRTTAPVVFALSVIVACQGQGSGSLDTAQAKQPPPDSAAAALGGRASTPGGSGAAQSDGKEPGTIPATPTPTVASESSISAMRSQLARWDTASAVTLQGDIKEHSQRLGDLLTTMRVEVQALTAPSKNAWLAAADTVESDLDKLNLAQGEELRTACRQHRDRVLRLMDQFRVLVPKTI